MQHSFEPSSEYVQAPQTPRGRFRQGNYSSQQIGLEWSLAVKTGAPAWGQLPRRKRKGLPGDGKNRTKGSSVICRQNKHQVIRINNAFVEKLGARQFAQQILPQGPIRGPWVRPSAGWRK